jgi:hypothetical protein
VGNYHLVEGRISPSTNTIELVYDSDRDAFAVFVTPRTANLSFGNYHLLSVDLSGLHCRRVPGSGNRRVLSKKIDDTEIRKMSAMLSASANSSHHGPS